MSSSHLKLTLPLRLIYVLNVKRKFWQHQKQRILRLFGLSLVVIMYLLGHFLPSYFIFSDDTESADLPGSLNFTEKPLICVLILACNRPSVRTCLNSVFEWRKLTPSTDFPVIVSQDCGQHPETTRVIKTFSDKIIHIHQPNLNEIHEYDKAIVGFAKQTRHHRWALDKAFNHYQCPHVITLEDDLEVSKDFFEYFAALRPVLDSDPSLYCVTASNLHAKPNIINANASDLLYRSDFFFGWGWMTSRDVFNTLGTWKKIYWDDWMGSSDVRRSRSCIRPEIPRTRNFGKFGTSGVTFYNTLIKDLVFQKGFTPFTKMDLSYLQKDKYDRDLKKRIFNSVEISSFKELHQNSSSLDTAYEKGTSYKILYKNKKQMTEFAETCGLYAQQNNGIVQTQYRGVLTCMYKGRRIYIAPKRRFLGYFNEK